MDILTHIENFLSFAITKDILDAQDIFYARNTLYDILKLEVQEAPHIAVAKYDFTDPQTEIFDCLTDYAISNGLIKAFERVLFETRIFSAVTPLPSVVIDKFVALKNTKGISYAADWFFEFSKNINYIRMVDINKNMLWKHNGRFGELEVTINLSKPEKTPEQIATEAKSKKIGYPKCVLCRENEGFAGHFSHPARQTLRIIPITLNNEAWGLQFSPYQYYREHCIALSMEHRPMNVGESCIARLLDFVCEFPDYFMGSNAALPIVGGSILAHDHYQGGAKVLPLFKSGLRATYEIKKFSNAKISIADWYNSTVRVESGDKITALNAAVYVLNAWKTYTDTSAEIIAFTENAPHNAVTPIARFENGVFVIDLILRNNRTDKMRPFGIFHPEESLHHIKKEGIGIIEVSGIFILPGRLKADLETGKLSRDEINTACEKILEATAVFKNTPAGASAFDKFMLTL